MTNEPMTPLEAMNKEIQDLQTLYDETQVEFKRLNGELNKIVAVISQKKKAMKMYFGVDYKRPPRTKPLPEFKPPQ